MSKKIKSITLTLDIEVPILPIDEEKVKPLVDKTAKEADLILDAFSRFVGSAFDGYLAEQAEIEGDFEIGLNSIDEEDIVEEEPQDVTEA